jgi:predicted nucleic acid-binding protein
MNGKFVLDTNTIIYHLQGLKLWTDFINDLPPDQALVSVITRMELLAWDGLTSNDEKQARNFLDLLVKIIPLSYPIENEAILLRRKARLKLPDAIVAATAVVSDAVLVTNDKAVAALNWPALKVISPA